MTDPKMGPPPWLRLHLAVFSQGAALLTMEIVLSRVLAVVMWHHFASLIISLALMGMTAGALVVYLKPGLAGVRMDTQRFLVVSNLLFGISSAAIFVFFWMITLFPTFGYRFFGVLHQPYFEPFGGSGGQFPLGLLLNLIVMFIVMAVPFFAGGMFITAVFLRYGGSTGSLYAADLLGAGSGCFLAVALLGFSDGISAVLLAAVPALAAALILARSGRLRGLATFFLAAVVLVAAGNINKPFARLMFVRGRFQPDILYEKWNATSRVVVYPLTGRQEEGSWGQSRRFRDRIPPQMGMVVDDTGYTTITAYPGDGDLEFMRHNLIALPYAVKPQAETLIIGPGGGRDILAAMAMEAKKIVAVEINPLVVEAVNGKFGEFSGGIYTREPVVTRIEEGRSFLRRHEDKYDVLQASVVYGRLPPSAGAFTLSEDQLYTRESFREFMGRLKEDGILSITRFVYEKRILRLVSLGMATLSELGREDPSGNFFIASERGLATIILKKKPFTPEEVKELEGWCGKMGYKVLYSPGGSGQGSFYRLIRAGDPAVFYDDFPFDITPPTDDRPYFYYLLKPADFWRTMVAGGNYEFEDRAIIIIRNALLVLALFTLLLIFIPLARRFPGGGDLGTSMGALGYFGGIALGFITVEIILLKTLILYLGYPVLSLGVVLASLLVSAGLGSVLAQKLFCGGRRARLAAWLFLVAVMITLFPLVSGPVLDGTVSAALPARIATAALLIFPLGFVMGVPLPAGLQVLRKRREALVPWAFGINGAFSVLGSMAALALTLNYGFRMTFLIGPAGYAAALLCLAAAGGGRHDK